MSHLTRASLLLAVFFAIDKGFGVLRQMLVARQFGLSPELDAFYAANNIPDLLFALISGGALAIAFIPVLSEYLAQKGRPEAWRLFSQIANLAFMVTGVLAILIGIFAEPFVGWELGIAPGFNHSQQLLVADLMRLNLAATLIFSLSGLVMAGLQANQHFFLPALAPLLYEGGQIFGTIILAPQTGYRLGPVTLPAFGMGIHGLVYGVIIGAALHLAVQIPGLHKYGFRWVPALNLRDVGVRQVLSLMGPRLITMFFIQLIFIARDNLASRLEAGAVTALVYGWQIMQIPETLIGTAIGTAMLPTMAELIAKGDWSTFKETLERALNVLIALTLPVAVILAVGIEPVVAAFFGFDAQGTAMVTWVARAYLAGVTGQSLLEVASRAFYAQKNACMPLLASAITLALFIGLSTLLFRWIGAAGIGLSDALAFTVEAVFLLFFLNRRIAKYGHLSLGGTLLRTVGGSILGGGVTYGVIALSPWPPLVTVVLAVIIGCIVTLPFVRKEIKALVRL